MTDRPSGVGGAPLPVRALAGEPEHPRAQPDHVTRYRFAEVSAALRSHWGLSLHRGGDMGDGTHDGRWDTAYSKTGYVVGGQLPGIGHGYRRFATLADVVTACDLADVLTRGQGTSGLQGPPLRRR